MSKETDIDALHKKIQELEENQKKLLEIIENTQYLRESKPRRNPKLKGALLDTPFPGIYTLDKCFEQSVQKFGDINCMGWRPLKKLHIEDREIDGKIKRFEVPEFGEPVWLTYKQVGERVEKIASGLIKYSGLKKGDMVAIYEETRPEWMQVAQACFKHGIIVVTCYANLGIDGLIHCLNQTECTLVVCNAKSIKTLDSIHEKCPKLKKLVYLDEKDSDSQYYETKSLDEIIEMGEKEKVPVEDPPKANDVAVIMYTSGSTGVPKGVMMAHRNFVAMMASVQFALKITSKDLYLAYLPLAHTFEMTGETCMLCTGAQIAYGSPRTLLVNVKPIGDIAAFRPTVMPGVPRVWDTVRKAILEKIAAEGPIKRLLFQSAYNAKKEAVRHGQTTPFWDYLIFSKIKERMGGRIRCMVSGGAPLSSETQEFIRVCFDVIVQGYGLTETCSGGTIQTPLPGAKFTTGNVGYPIGCCEIKLVDVPDMGYFSSENTGEIAIRGSNVSLGYYKEPEKTKEVFTKDGWFLTGDIGRWNKDGTLSIIDRKKNLVKLAHGEYVAIENLEMIYGTSPFVAPNGIMIYADPLKDWIIALILPQVSFIKTWAKENQVEGDLDTILKSPKLYAAMAESFKKIATEHKKKKFEEIKAFRVFNEEWTPENTMLTAAMKLKRENIQRKYKQDIDELYASIKS